MKKVILLLTCVFIYQIGFAQIDDVFKKSCFKIGVSLPQGDFGKTSGKNAGYAKTGLAVEVGTFGYLTKKSDYAFGINTVLGYSFNMVDYEAANPLYDYATPYHFGEFKLGPVFSFNVVEELVVDLFVRANGMISWGPKYSYELLGHNEETEGNYALGVGFNTGFNIRYSSFLFGLEWDMDRLKYVYPDIDDLEHKQKTNTLRINVGVCW